MLVWVEHLALWMNGHGLPAVVEVVRYAAITHDVGRRDDGHDPGHGGRSTRWVARHRATGTAALTEVQLTAVTYCCAWHVPSDACAPNLTNGLVCLTDADGLDRVRIFNLDPGQLRADLTRSLTDPASWLFAASNSAGAGDPWERVRAAAQAMGLWRKVVRHGPGRIPAGPSRPQHREKGPSDSAGPRRARAAAEGTPEWSGCGLSGPPPRRAHRS